MDKILSSLGDFSVTTVLLRLICAALMGGLIGFERGRHGRAAGLRTHILICVGAAITALTGLFLIKAELLAGDAARLSAQVISGIGFLGAGIILVRNGSVITGLTTAAGMWATAAIGVAVGFGFYSGAVFATLICVLTVTVLSRLERSRKNQINGYVELSDISEVGTASNILRSLGDRLYSYEIMPPKSGNANNIGIIFTVKNEECYIKVQTEMTEKTNIKFILELKE